MKFVCIVFELGDKMLTLPSMENLKVQCNLSRNETEYDVFRPIKRNYFGILINTMYAKRHSSRIF